MRDTKTIVADTLRTMMGATAADPYVRAIERALDECKSGDGDANVLTGADGRRYMVVGFERQPGRYFRSVVVEIPTSETPVGWGRTWGDPPVVTVEELAGEVGSDDKIH